MSIYTTTTKSLTPAPYYANAGPQVFGGRGRDNANGVEAGAFSQCRCGFQSSPMCW